MNTKEIKNYIEQNLINSAGRINSAKITSMLKNDDKNIGIINDHVKFLNSDATMAEKIYCILNDITKPKLCLNEKCNNHVKFKTPKYGYRDFCSTSCSSTAETTIKKSKETNKQKYGVDSYTKTKEFKEKVIKTNIETYGVEHVLQISEVRQKAKDTKLQRYENENYVNSEKAKKTKLELYGDENFVNPEKAQETKLKKYSDKNYNNPNKIKETKLKKYGNGNYANTEKAISTKLERYGVKSFTNIEKTKQTKLERYGTENYTNKEKMKKTRTENHIKKYSDIKDYIKSDGFDILKMMDDKSITRGTVNNLKRLFGINHNNKSQKISLEERINIEFDNEFVINDRNIIKPLEIDLLNEEYKFGIEYNGLMWHSVGKSEYSMFNNYLDENSIKSKHLNKTNLMEDKGYQLFHIFENEWLDKNKKSIWISIIKDKLNKNKKIDVKKCVIKEVSTEEAKNFIDENHLQGYINAHIKIGLYHKNELVSIMTFSNSEAKYDLLRFCTKKEYTISDKGSMLLAYFEKVYRPELISYKVNRRWDSRIENSNLGFEFSHYTEPNSFCFHPKEDILLLKNEHSDNKNIYDNGYRKIYDSGNIVYIKNYH